MWFQPFRQHLWVRLLCAGLAVAVIALAGVNIVRALQPPEVIQSPSASYEHHGSFSYAARLRPSTLYGEGLYIAPGTVEEETEEEEEAEEEGPIRLFFRNMVEEFWLEFPYSLETSEPLRDLQVSAELVVYAQDPGLWKADVARFYETHRAGDFEMRVDLDLDRIADETEEIEEDVGISGSTDDYIIEMTIVVEGTTEQGRDVHDEFVHEMTGVLDENTFELEGDWGDTQTHAASGVSLTHEGRFEYEVFLNSTRLYEEGVIRSWGIPTAEDPTEDRGQQASTTIVGPGSPVYTRLVNSVQGEFSYFFTCECPVSSASHTVSIDALLESGDRWSKRLEVIPARDYTEPFTVTFPIDVEFYRAVVNAIVEETGTTGGTYAVNLVARVDTVATTSMGTVNERFTHTLKGELGAATLTFGEELDAVQEGTLGGGTVTVGNQREGFPVAYVVVGGLGILALAFILWSWRQLGLAGLSDADRAAAAAAKKYGDQIVGVSHVPEAGDGTTVVDVESVEDLTNIAAECGKPVLHHVVDGEHRFVVLDGMARYEHAMKPEEEGKGGE